MGVSRNIKAHVDSYGRVMYYTYKKGRHCSPIEVAGMLDGPVLVEFEGEPHVLDQRANLVGKNVVLPRVRTMGWGILIKAGVEFKNPDSDVETTLLSGSAIINRDRSEQPSIGVGLKLGERAVLAATLVRNAVVIGRETTIGDVPVIGSNTEFGNMVKIIRSGPIGDSVKIKDRAEIDTSGPIADYLQVAEGATIATHGEEPPRSDRPNLRIVE